MHCFIDNQHGRQGTGAEASDGFESKKSIFGRFSRSYLKLGLNAFQDSTRSPDMAGRPAANPDDVLPDGPESKLRIKSSNPEYLR